MKVGTSQTDITPEPGVELSGFAARTQPSTGVLDPLNYSGDQQGSRWEETVLKMLICRIGKRCSTPMYMAYCM